MSTTTQPERTDLSEPSPRPPRRGRGDAVFRGLSTAAGVTILMALLAVSVFLAAEGWNGLTGGSATFAPFTSFGTYIWPLLVSTWVRALLSSSWWPTPLNRSSSACLPEP